MAYALVWAAAALSAAVFATVTAALASVTCAAALSRALVRSVPAWVNRAFAGRFGSLAGFPAQNFCQVRIWSASHAWPIDSIIASVAFCACAAAVVSAAEMSARGLACPAYSASHSAYALAVTGARTRRGSSGFQLSQPAQETLRVSTSVRYSGDPSVGACAGKPPWRR
ncbi:hypothetical protein a10_09478 [Streptomyces acidiscabies]|nr:hypothetical protein a10_09478 [Streptomyces acidiscabies]